VQHEKIFLGKHMVISTEVPQVVVRRFPHLGDQIVARAVADVSFLSLCDDYSSLVTTLASLEGGAGESREELMSLKASLEVEILERLTRSLDDSGDKGH
jgi:hypothetical protein